MAGTAPSGTFSLTADRYDQTKFTGRLDRITALFNPLFLHKADEDIAAAKKLLEDFDKGVLPDTTKIEDLWQARELIECRCHPDTGEQIPRLLCFAAYAPMQPPIILGMMWPGASMANVLFWQWYNQSFNVAVNYANKNAAGELTDTQLVTAYTVAVGTSIGLAYGLSKVSDRLSKKFPGGATAVKMGIPFCAVVAAGTASLLVVRQGELKNGVAVKDIEGRVHGNSKVAAQNGLAQCAMARVLWNIPVLIMPPVVMGAMDKTKAFKGKPVVRLGFLTALSTVAVILGLYPAQAVYPQQASIPAEKIEPQFQGLKDSKGDIIQKFFYNKGL